MRRGIAATRVKAAAAAATFIAGLVASGGASAQDVPPPVNDNFASAMSITGFPGGVDADLCGATSEPDQPSGLRNPIWFNFTPTTDNALEIRIDRPSGDYADIRVFSGDSLSTLSEVALDRVNIASIARRTDRAYVFRNPRPGEEYHVAAEAGTSRCSAGNVRVDVGPEVVAKTNKKKFKPRFPVQVASSATTKAAFSGSLLYVPASGSSGLQTFKLTPVVVKGKPATSPSALMRLAKPSDCDRVLRVASSNNAYVIAVGGVKLTGGAGSVAFPWMALMRPLSASDRGDIRAGAGEC